MCGDGGENLDRVGVGFFFSWFGYFLRAANEAWPIEFSLDGPHKELVIKSTRRDVLLNIMKLGVT